MLKFDVPLSIFENPSDSDSDGDMVDLDIFVQKLDAETSGALTWAFMLIYQYDDIIWYSYVMFYVLCFRHNLFAFKFYVSDLSCKLQFKLYFESWYNMSYDILNFIFIVHCYSYINDYIVTNLQTYMHDCMMYVLTFNF